MKCVKYVEELSQSIATGSWDRTVKYWSTTSVTGKPIMEVQVPERVYAMDIRYPLLCVITASREVLLYDLRNPQALAAPAQVLHWFFACLDLALR